MKTRLLIASIFTVAVALVLAITLRTSASAQGDVEQVAENESEESTAAESQVGADDPDVSAEPTGNASAPAPAEEREELSDEQPALVIEIPDDAGEAVPGNQEGIGGEMAVPREDASISTDGDDASGTPVSAGTTDEPVGVWDDGNLEGEPMGVDPNVESAEGESEDDSTEAATVEGVEGEVVPEDVAEPALTLDLDAPPVPLAVELDEELDTVTVDFPDEEIRTILRQVADVFELNLVIPETLIGRTSITLRDVTWRQVFDIVLTPAGFTFIEEGNIIKVVSRESVPLVTRVVILNYAQAESILPIIELPGSDSRIRVDERSNALVITARPEQLRQIEETILELDQPNVQVMIESKFVETQNRHIENIGVNWASLSGYSMRAGPFTHEYTQEDVDTRGSGRDQSTNSSTTQQQSSQSTSSNTGNTTSSTTSNVAEAGQVGSAFNNFSDTSTTTNLSSAVFSADQFNVILSALETTNDVKLVSNPTVVALDGQQAQIHIGEEFPVVYPRYNPETGSYEAGESETERVGIQLQVTPSVNNTGFITLDVRPEVSSLSGTVSYFGAEYPIKAIRSAETVVTVKDGFTVAIGGLVQEDTVADEQRVPVLGSIPGVGRLFRSNSSDNDQRNLIIFLTARTLSPNGSTVENMVDPRMIHSMGLTREEIPGYRPDIEMWPDSAPEEDASETEVDVDIDLQSFQDVLDEVDEDIANAEAEADPEMDPEAEESVDDSTSVDGNPEDATTEDEAIEGAPVEDEAAESTEVPVSDETAAPPATDEAETAEPNAEAEVEEEAPSPTAESEDLPAVDAGVAAEPEVVPESTPEPESEPEPRGGGWLTPMY